MTTRNRPRPSKAINLREKVRMRKKEHLSWFEFLAKKILSVKPRTLMGDEVED